MPVNIATLGSDQACSSAHSWTKCVLGPFTPIEKTATWPLWVSVSQTVTRANSFLLVTETAVGSLLGGN